MEQYKKILIVITIIVICIICLTVALLMLQKKEVIKEDNPPTLAFVNVEKLQNKTLFFQINDYIKTYVNYAIENNNTAINALSPNSSELKINGTKKYVTYTPSEMYVLDKINNITVFIKEFARERQIQDEYYFIINMDYSNNTYEIIISSKQEFDNAKNNTIKDTYKKDILIQENTYNKIKKGAVSDFQVLKEYFDDYKFKAIYYPEEAFTLIDETYKKEKFHNNIEEYKTYIQNNKDTLQDANIVKHGVTREGNYIKYTFVDNFNNYYELKETGIYEYTILLDNYTVTSDEQMQKYNKLTDEQKALSNIDKVMKLIDQKDYSTIYNYLNADFRNNNFPTLESFTKYIKENFFEDNIVGKIGIKKEGNIFILSVPYKESLSTAAEDFEKNFIMQLKEGMNFELSFEI